MIGYLYILRSDKTGKYYIGSTKDVDERLKQHNQGMTKSLKNQIPLKIMFSQKYLDIKTARQAEYRLKKQKSRIILEKIIKDQVYKSGR